MVHFIYSGMIKINLNDKYFCYLLGLLWSDGYIHKNRIEVSMVHEDLKTLEYVFNYVGQWKRYERIRKNKNFKKQLILRTSDKNFYSFLKKNDFDIKSKTSPTKILMEIPEINKRYFVRGLFDGDGCFYTNGKSINQCIFTSNYEQDWNFLIEILNKNMITKISIGKQDSKTGRRSFLRLTSKNVVKIGDYLYDDFFGLERKYKKFEQIKKYYLIPKKKEGNNKKKIIIDDKIYDSITEASQILLINRECIRYRLISKNYSNYNYI